VQHPQAAPLRECPPQGFAVNRDHFPAGRLVQRLRAEKQARGELATIVLAEHTAKGVVRGDAVGKLEGRLEEVFAGFGELLDIRRVFRSAHHGQQRDGHDVQEQMITPRHHARIVEPLQAPLQPPHILASLVHEPSPQPLYANATAPSRDTRRPDRRKMPSGPTLRSHFDAPALGSKGGTR